MSEEGDKSLTQKFRSIWNSFFTEENDDPLAYGELPPEDHLREPPTLWSGFLNFDNSTGAATKVYSSQQASEPSTPSQDEPSYVPVAKDRISQAMPRPSVTSQDVSKEACNGPSSEDSTGSEPAYMRFKDFSHPESVGLESKYPRFLPLDDSSVSDTSLDNGSTVRLKFIEPIPDSEAHDLPDTLVLHHQDEEPEPLPSDDEPSLRSFIYRFV